MAASRMCHGVSKSGSPMPSEMTFFIFATISKKSRMPDLGRSTTWEAIKRFGSMMRGKHALCVQENPAAEACVQGV